MDSEADPAPDKKITVLVTAFDSWGSDVNISAETLKRLQATYPNVTLVTLLLPQEYGPAEQKITEAISTYCPDLVVSLGEINEEPGPGMQVEPAADSKSSQNDRSGNKPPHYTRKDNQKITSYFPKLETVLSNSFNQHMESTDGAQRNKYGSGSYLCNDIYYTALKVQATHGKPGQAMFLHLDDMTPIKLPGEDCDEPAAKPPPSMLAFRDSMLNQKRAIVSDRYAKVVGDLLTYLGEHPDAYKAQHEFMVENLTEKKEGTVLAEPQKAASLNPYKPPMLYPVRHVDGSDSFTPLLPSRYAPRERQ